MSALARLLLFFVSSFLYADLAPTQSPGPNPEPQLTTAQWRQDLRFLAENLSTRHANAFHFTSKESFDREVNELDQRIAVLSADQIFVGMDRIENSVGDGHTYVRVPAQSPGFPVRFEPFGSELRLTAAANSEQARAAVGGNLISVNGVPVSLVRQRLLTLTPSDEGQALRELRVATLLGSGAVLHGLDITHDRNAVEFHVRKDDGVEVSLHLVAHANYPAPEDGWLDAGKALPLYLQRPTENFWCTEVRSAEIGYCNFRSYKELASSSQALRDLLSRQPKNLVIDLRHNYGGDFDLGLRYVVRPIQHSTVNRRGHLFVLIGPRTFSAAMSNASHFRQQTEAILVGQPIAKKPNSYQEAEEVELPNSHWIARYSTKFYRFATSSENEIRPDRYIPESWSDYKSGKDPVLDWVIRRTSASGDR